MANILKDKMKILNIGSNIFQEDYNIQNIQYVQVDWKPSNIKPETLNALEILEKNIDKINKANEEFISKIKFSISCFNRYKTSYRCNS